MSDGLQRELLRFDPDIPIERAHTPPASWYVEDTFLQIEKDAVFGDGWICVGRAEQVSGRGSYAAYEIGGRHYLVVRDEREALRAFHNVCRHHAARLADGAGTCTEIVCPYHGWTYGLDGALRRAPHVGGIRDFDRDAFRLREIAVRAWGPLLFLHAGGTPPRDLERDLEDALDLDAFAAMRWVASREYRLRCNWKVFVDNYLDGGYHVPVLHEELSSHLDLAGYRTELSDRFSVQSCASGDGDPRLGERARYVWIYPNLMVNEYGPIVDVNRVVPLAVDETLVVFDWFFAPRRAEDSEFVERSLAASQRVQEEDIAICESVQSGLASPAYDRGRYAPRLETGELHFHRLLAGDLRRAAGITAPVPRSGDSASGESAP